HDDSLLHPSSLYTLFYSTDPATTEIYTLSLHDALPISSSTVEFHTKEILSLAIARSCMILEALSWSRRWMTESFEAKRWRNSARSEEHTSELQSRGHLVCRLLLEKKKHTKKTLN